MSNLSEQIETYNVCPDFLYKEIEFIPLSRIIVTKVMLDELRKLQEYSTRLQNEIQRVMNKYPNDYYKHVDEVKIEPGYPIDCDLAIQKITIQMYQINGKDFCVKICGKMFKYDEGRTELYLHFPKYGKICGGINRDQIPPVTLIPIGNKYFKSAKNEFKITNSVGNNRKFVGLPDNEQIIKNSEKILISLNIPTEEKCILITSLYALHIEENPQQKIEMDDGDFYFLANGHHRFLVSLIRDKSHIPSIITTDNIYPTNQDIKILPSDTELCDFIRKEFERQQDIRSRSGAKFVAKRRM